MSDLEISLEDDDIPNVQAFPVRRESSVASSTYTTTSPRPFDIQGLTSEEVDNIWTKLRECSFGSGRLNSDDAYEILCLISSLIRADVTKTYDEVTESIFQNVAQDDLNSLDEDYLRHLVTTYSKLMHSEQDDTIIPDNMSLNLSTMSTGGSSLPKDEGAEQHREDLLLAERLKLSGETVLMLGQIKDWNFDLFRLEGVTEYPMVAIAEAALNDLHLTFALDLNIMKLRRYLAEISDTYLPQPYHNQWHAADVTQTMYHLCTSCHLTSALGLNNLAVLALIISAAVHDVAHPGVNGKFLIATFAPLAIQYNDNSPLENMHLATSFTLMAKEKNNFTENLPKPAFRDLRRMMIEMILSTDNDRHFALMEKVESLINSGDAVMTTPSPMRREPSVGGKGLARTQSAYLTAKDIDIKAPSGRRKSEASGIEDLQAATATQPTLTKSSTAFLSWHRSNSTTSAPTPTTPGASSSSSTATTTPVAQPPAVTESRQLLLMQLALHAADVSNPVKPWELHLAWYPRLMKEFYLQGDQERELAIPITYGFDRFNPISQPKFQLGFLKAIVSPMYRTFARIPGLNIQHCLSTLDNNIANWETLIASPGSEGLTVPEDVLTMTASMGLNGKAWTPKSRIQPSPAPAWRANASASVSPAGSQPASPSK